MRKLLSITLALLLLASIMTGCEKKTSADIKPINPPTESTEPTDKPSDTLPDETTPSTPEIPKQPENAESLKFEFINFNRNFLDFKSVSSFDISASMIDIPTKVSIDGPIIEKFSTEEEFKSYLSKYGNIENHSADEVTIKDGEYGMEFTYTHGASFAMSTGYNLEFYFIAHPDMPAGYELDINTVLYDKDGKNAYILLEKGEYKPNSDATSTAGILYVSVDEDFAKENEIGNIYIVLPEKDDPIVINNEQGNKHGSYEFIAFNRNILDFEELWTFDIGASVIQIPTTKTPSTSVFEKFESESELRGFLTEYGDVLDHSNDVIEYEETPTGFIFNYSGPTSISSTSGFDTEFYFMAHPCISGNYELDDGEVYYDETTGNVYITFIKGEYTNYDNANSTCGIVYISIDEDFRKENEINKIYLVLPE
jgi:hypothetical protein